MKCQFYPLQPLISFVSDTPRLAWVTSPKVYGWFMSGEKVLVSHNYNEAVEGLGRDISIDKVKPYTAGLWADCLAWIERREQIGIEYEILKRGKSKTNVASKSPVPPWQASLLEAST